VGNLNGSADQRDVFGGAQRRCLTRSSADDERRGSLTYQRIVYLDTELTDRCRCWRNQVAADSPQIPGLTIDLRNLRAAE
jgi:hypothetical protein